MHARPLIGLPVCRNVTAGSWLIGSVCIERITVSRSTMPESWGSSSETSRPASPCREKAKCEPASGKLAWPLVMVVSRCMPTTLLGISLPLSACSRGLGSRRSICEGPPERNTKITLLARAAVWPAAAAAVTSRPLPVPGSSEASAAAPRPREECRRNCLRQAVLQAAAMLSWFIARAPKKFMSTRG